MLLVMAFILMFGVRSLFSTVSNDVVNAESAPEDASTTTLPEDTVVDPDTPLPGDDPEGDDTETDEPTVSQPKPAAEVTVRVGNGARRAGVAGTGTSVLEAAGYRTLAPRNAPTMNAGVVYYTEGFDGNAAQVAGILGMAPTAIAPMPDAPPVPLEGANVLAILGSDTTLS